MRAFANTRARLALPVAPPAVTRLHDGAPFAWIVTVGPDVDLYFDDEAFQALRREMNEADAAGRARQTQKAGVA
jgi:hypothetical protein